MSEAAALSAAAVLLAFAAARDLAAARGEALARGTRAVLRALGGGRLGSFGEAGLRLGVPGRIERAGLSGRLPVAAVVAAKLAGAGAGALVAASAVPALPGRLAAPAAALLVVAGFIAPDALLERRARLRRERLVAALPDALDLLAVSAGAGRGAEAALAEVAGRTAGPLAAELAATTAAIECGSPVAEAVADLRRRIPGPELGALAAALERSRRYGSSLAEQLNEQAAGLRRDAQRRIGERAARAAPKIQLVVALVLVPSVLLVLLAAILAHSEALFGAF